MGINLIVKPTYECNLKCKYCHVDKESNLQKMNDDTLINLLSQASEISPKNANFIWHGGEPLLMGPSFYEKVAYYSNKLRNQGKNITNRIQTNGTLVNDDLLEFISQQKDFYLGFSLDGPEEINNLTRVYGDGRGAFKEIFAGIKKVRDKTPEHAGAITVVNKLNLPYLREIYHFFNKEHLNLKLNPIMDHRDPKMGISMKEYTESMCSLFDEWIEDQNAIEIDPFSQIMGNLISKIPSGCIYSESCRNNFLAIGPEGDVYPCGKFDKNPQFYLGNIHNPGGLESALKSPIQERLINRKTEEIDNCRVCNYRNICNGGCPHNALISGDIMGKDPYCYSYKEMFRHIEDKLHKEFKKIEMKGGNKNGKQK
ncbi:MAG: radical SAM protein [Candidatus Nanoarchaeia archaeon]